jgi:hypothetical protein
MVALDLSGDTILKPCTTTFEQAWGLPCPHLVQRLMRERQPLEIEDFDIHWQLDRDVVLTLNWSDITQPPERVRRRGRQERDTRRLPSEFERVDNALHRLPPGLPRASQQPHPPPSSQSHTTRGGSQRAGGRGGGRGGRVPGGRLQPGESVLQF